jgi:hypothetical protein
MPAHAAAIMFVVAITRAGLAANGPVGDPPATTLPSFATIESAIEFLAAEAETARDMERLPHDEPNLASRINSTIPPADISIAVVQRQHDDPFADAYIRWQLTSFGAALPEMDDATFLRMMDAAPALREHPRASQAVLDLAALVEERGVLSARDIERLREYVDSMNHESMIVEELNRPAREWRAWVAGQLGKTGYRPRLWMVEDLAARIRAGWPASDLKADMSRDFTNSVADGTFTPEQRHDVILHLSRLIGPGRRYLHDVTYFAGGRVEVSFRTVAVDRDDVETWRKRLAGIRID